MRFRIIIINMKASLRHKHNTHSPPSPPFEEDLQSQTCWGRGKKKVYAKQNFFSTLKSHAMEKITQNSLLLLKLYKFLALCFATQPLGFLHIENTQ